MILQSVERKILISTVDGRVFFRALEIFCTRFVLFYLARFSEIEVMFLGRGGK